MNTGQLWFCDAVGAEAYKVYDEGEQRLALDSSELELCAPSSCAHCCLLLQKGAALETDLGLAIAQAEVAELKSRIALRNRQIRDLRRQARK